MCFVEENNWNIIQSTTIVGMQYIRASFFNLGLRHPLYQLSEKPDWAFMREKQNNLAFLFGIDDHWGPLSMFEEARNLFVIVGLNY